MDAHVSMTKGRQKESKAGWKLAVLTTVSAMTLGLPWAASAQESEELVVTGSRITTQGFTAPTPVTTLGQAEINERAPTTLGETLQTLPSFRQAAGAAPGGVTSRGGGQVIADLRGLGSERTLALVNGRRFVPTTAEGTVDLKLIPTLLVNSVEVVTGGASAAWGSDAVAGVVNLILKDRIDGIQGTVQGGMSDAGDYKEYRVSLASGWTGEKARIIGGLDYLRNDGIGNPYTRDWGAKEGGLITNTAFATNGLPNLILAENVHTANMTPGGLVTAGPLKGLQFLPNGQTSTYNFGQTFGALMIGGDGFGNNLSNATVLATPLRSATFFTKADYDFNEYVQAYAELASSWAYSGGASQQPRDAGNLTVQRDNAYLPASVRTQMTTLGITTLTVGRLSNDTGPIALDNQTQSNRGVIGLKGSLGNTWTWDAYWQYGISRANLRTGPNNRVQVNWARAIDAVVAPNGSVVCRSTLTTPTDGCIPINIFGDGSAVPNAYAFGTAWFNLKNQQTVYAASLQGEPFSTWAGPISVVVGGEYRLEKAVANSDAISQTVQANGALGGWVLGNQAPLYGKFNVKEFFGEIVVPLLSEQPLAQSLDFNGAVRRTDYSTFGEVTTWKAGFSWKPHDDVRFRATRSHDIRAPNFTELYQAGGSSNTFVFDPVLNASVQIRNILTGNPDLQPEEADTWTGGVVYQPTWFSGFSASVDYYDISVEDVIASIDAPTLTQRCFAGLTEFCSSVVFNPNGSVAFTLSQNRNLNALETNGWDYELSYRSELSRFFASAPGEIDIRFLATNVKNLISIDSAGPTERVGKVSNHVRIAGVPSWVSTTNITYSIPTWTFNLQTRFVGEGVYNGALTEGVGAVNTISDNTVPAYVYFSANVQHDLELWNGRTVQLFGIVNNIMDKSPPNIPSGAAGGINESSTNGAYYDVIGRNYRIGLRFKL